ncbi:MAG: UDP-N-acetylmuramoyl-L-alanine--D-glutamate ligase [bacterium]|nr:UDP-N-acetylmuramoyl-L-alanine--D-glutamate ligase [bacterium]
MKKERQMKRVGIVGFQRSGMACAKALLREGAGVFISDSSAEAKAKFKVFLSELSRIPEFSKKTTAAGAGCCMQIQGEFGVNSEKLLQQDMIIVSPGVPLGLPIFQKAQKKGIPVIGELEFAYMSLNSKQKEIIGVTGTNGKTTTVHLINNILKAAKKNSVVCGNTGTAFTAIVDSYGSQNFIPVIEISSFQLESIKAFRPKVGVLLNVTADHLNRYKNIGEYKKAKLRLFMNQTKDDFAILNFDDENMRALKLKSRKLYFSTVYKRTSSSILSPDIWTEGNDIICNTGKSSRAVEKFNTKTLNIRWGCLMEDYLAAILAAKALGIGRRYIIEGLKVFKGVSNRMEEVDTCFSTSLKTSKGIRVINNSMCTNPAAFIKVLNSLGKTGKISTILIAGGKEKNFSTIEMVKAMNKNTKFCVLIGEAAKRLSKGLTVKHKEAKNMESAVKIAFSEAQKGDVIILSPGFASFDWYRDYSARGEDFRQKVKAYETSRLGGDCKQSNKD